MNFDRVFDYVGFIICLISLLIVLHNTEPHSAILKMFMIIIQSITVGFMFCVPIEKRLK